MSHSASSMSEGPEHTPLRAPREWQAREKFNESFELVASGWQQLHAQKAAHEVSLAIGSEVAAVERKPTPGRLFIAGDMGYLGHDLSESSHYAGATLNKIAKSLSLVGDLRIEGTKSSVAGNYIEIGQEVDGLRIYGAQFAMYTNLQGLAYALAGTPASGELEVESGTRKITEQDAVQIVADELGTTALELQQRTEEVLFPIDRYLRPCYLVRAIAKRPFGDWQALIDLRGELIAIFNIASAAVGHAKGYKVNPERNVAIEPLTLTELPNPPNLLAGIQSEVWGTDRKRVSSQTGNFDFEPSQREFDEPQLYYFLQFCRDAAQSLVGGNLASVLSQQVFNPLRATVHVREAPDNAFFTPDDGQLYFGDRADDNRCSSRSLDIVLHEFGHVITDTICRLGRARQHDPCRAMSEGYSDYLAATVLDVPIIGDYFAPEDTRTCANKLRFPKAYLGEEHDVGTVWAGMLWDLRQEPAVGKETTDALVLQSLSYLGPWRTINQGIEALVQADRVLYPLSGEKKGQHEDVIQDIFNARKP